MELGHPSREDLLPGGLTDQSVPHGARSADTELQYPLPGTKDMVHSNLQPTHMSHNFSITKTQLNLQLINTTPTN